MRTRLSFSLICFAAILISTGAPAAAQKLSAQSSTAAGVTVKATPRTLSGATWEFEIVFDSHTQELKDDLPKSASLVAGGKTLAPAAWQGDPPGGHHREGTLRFNAIAPRPESVELQIQRPGEPRPRSLRWQLK
jgi:hypothetical protein